MRRPTLGAARHRAVEATPQTTLPEDATLATLAGDPARARLAITLDPKDGGPIYQGIVALEAASIAALIEHYLATSEQIDSRLLLATDASGCAACCCSECRAPSTTTTPRGRQSSPRARPRETPSCSAPRASRSFWPRRFPDHDVRVVRTAAARFACGCSDDRIVQRAQDARSHRDREHSRRAGDGRRDLRVLRPSIPLRRRRRARAVRARGRRPRRAAGCHSSASRR